MEHKVEMAMACETDVGQKVIISFYNNTLVFEVFSKLIECLKVKIYRDCTLVPNCIIVLDYFSSIRFQYLNIYVQLNTNNSYWRGHWLFTITNQ